MDAIEIWERVERSRGNVVASGAEKAAKDDDDDAPKGRGAKVRRRLKLLTLDVVATALWTYWLLKVFVADVDRALLERVAPGHLGLLDYRLFVYLLVIAVALLLMRRWQLLGAAAYIVFFPFVFVFWKIPAFFIRRRSWTLAMGAVNALFVTLGDFKYSFISKTLAAIAALVILTSSSKPLIALSALYIAGLLVWSFVRAVQKSFRASLFIRKQSDTIGRLVLSDRITSLTSIDDDLKRDDIDVYSHEQLTKFATNLSLGLVVNRGLYFWAFQLDRYRKKSSAPVLLSGLTYLWLFLGAFIGFTLLNYGLLAVEPSEFRFNENPSFVAVALYSLTSLGLSDGGGFTADGDLAYLLRIFAGLYGPVALATFVVNIAFAARRERDDEAIRETIEDVRERARQQEAALASEYAVSVDEARRRLDKLNLGLGWLIGFMTAGIPNDFFDDEDSTS